MRLKPRQEVVQVRGSPKPTTRRASEWLCPECDYFEEAEEEKA
jgi:hypothetical protein